MRNLFHYCIGEHISLDIAVFDGINNLIFHSHHAIFKGNNRAFFDAIAANFFFSMFNLGHGTSMIDPSYLWCRINIRIRIRRLWIIGHS
jgi:hypothetical protein